MTFEKKYAPKSIGDVVFPDDATQMKINRWVTSKSQKPLLLSGPPGTGKTTLAKLLPYAMYPDFDDANLQHVIGDARNNVASRLEALDQFCSMAPFGNCNRVVVIDEIDNLPLKLQKSLKGHLDQYKEHVHFIFTTNYVERLEEPMRSRCYKLRVNYAQASRWTPRLQKIMEREGITSLQDADLMALAERAGGDCRTILEYAEDLVASIRQQMAA